MNQQNEQPRTPTQEELRQYLLQMREIPVSELLLQSLGMLAGGAEAKLGREDARVLIDCIGAILEIAKDHLGEPGAQLTTMHGQLQAAQVQVESAVKAQAEAEGKTVEELHAEADKAAKEQIAAAADQASTQEAPKKSGSKLWVPGQ